MTKLTPREFLKAFPAPKGSRHRGLFGLACDQIEALLDENERLHEHLRQRELAEELRADDEAHRSGLGVLLGMED